jgi:ElaB/YqjD/DUF883 family membrane-anchored ribosome-binding protein
MAKSKEFTSKPNNEYSSELSSVKSAYTDLRADVAAEYPEIQDIREDLNSLKDNVLELSRHVKKNSTHHIDDVKNYAEKQIDKAKRAGADALHKVESRAVENPGQTIAIAFFAGLATSFLLGRRR